MDNLAHGDAGRLSDGRPQSGEAGRGAATWHVELLGSLNVRRTVLRVLAVTQDRLADWAALVLEEPTTGRLQVYVGSGPDPIRTVRRRAGDDRPVGLPLDPQAPTRLAPAVLADLLGMSDPSSATTGVDAYALPGRQGTLGALLVGRTTARPWTGEDVDEVMEIAQMAALALESAFLHERHVRAIRLLEESLRPPELPASGSLQVAACFRPAAEHLDIGGDFYDLHGTEDDRLLVLGDVCGKGVEAAVLNGRARQTIRTAARFGLEPGPVLQTLNEVLCEEETDRFVTVVCCRLRSRSDGSVAVDVATAGHPAPLVVRADRSIEEPSVRGRLAGVIPDVGPYEQVRLRLWPGDTLVLYSDGVHEARGPDGFYGTQRLRRLLADYAGAGARATCEAIERDVVEHLAGFGHDDVTAVAVTPLAPGRPR